MEPLEDELRLFFRRRSPSPGFTARVVAGVAGRRPRTGVAWWLRRVAAGSLAASMVMGGWLWIEHRRTEGARAEEARDQLVLSLAIAGAEIEKARQMVINSIGRDRL